MHNLEIHTRLCLILKSLVHMFYESSCVSFHYTCLLSVFNRKLAESNKRGTKDWQCSLKSCYKSVFTVVHYQVVENLKCFSELLCSALRPSVLAKWQILKVSDTYISVGWYVRKVILIEVPIGRTSATLTVLKKKEYFILHDKGMWIFCVLYSSNKKCFYFFS